ncbi:MAG: glycogen/starch/alpha-glucan phosphorylase [Desulfobacterales bacterium]
MNKDQIGRRHIESIGFRNGMSMEHLKAGFYDNLFYCQGRYTRRASANDSYMALARTVRDRLLHRWIHTVEAATEAEVRTVCYISAEYLLGPYLGAHLVNLGIYDEAASAMAEIGLDLESLLEEEEEPGLGSGGLGRLAACFLDSLATLGIPAIGYGLRYEFGIFDQEIKDGYQVEITDKWLNMGNPWEMHRPEAAYEVKFGGYTEGGYDKEGRFQVRWVPERVVVGVAMDTPVSSYGVNNTNLLRLWKAEARESFDFQAFNTGDYYGAVEEKVVSENITKVLYPNDEQAKGKQLRLEQQYFLISCSLQDMIRLHRNCHDSLDNFHEYFAVQLNDTHPAMAIPELMRILVDENGFGWDHAWSITEKTFSYTNHTLLPEALEKWPIDMFGGLFPRHLEIIYEINRRFLENVQKKFPAFPNLAEKISIIEEGERRFVRMANLACIGSHAINGVSALHTSLLKEGTFREFSQIWPEKIRNITNGVTPRRFLVLSNPGLANLITREIGDSWVASLEKLQNLEPLIEDPDFRNSWRMVKTGNKKKLASVIEKRTGIRIDPDSLFDIQVKRLHEYKRQLLNILHIISLYNYLRRNPQAETASRTFIFGGKAAPGYFIAKLIIKLITSVGDKINNDPALDGRIRVVFFPDFNVKNAQLIYPAGEISEQISTAGYEASGTGNMKFALNGALTIGTVDGANVEIMEEVGAENFFVFGLTSEQVREVKLQGYRPMSIYRSDDNLREALDQIKSGFFSNGNKELFRPLVDSLLFQDTYLVLKDYESYINCQHQVGRIYLDKDQWTKMSILNTARMGKFSSDRSVREYCRDIWKVRPIEVKIRDQ